MMKATYIGSHNWFIEFDSGTEVILSTSELKEIEDEKISSSDKNHPKQIKYKEKEENE